jgi:hypothetical protein
MYSFTWSSNLKQTQIVKTENFNYINRTYSNSDLVFYLEYFSNQTLSNSSLPIKLVDININGSLQDDLQTILSYCELFDVTVLNVTDYI